MAKVPLNLKQHKQLIFSLSMYGQIDTKEERKSFYVNTGLNQLVPDVQYKIGLELSTEDFCQAIISYLQNRGTLEETQEPALVLVLRYLSDKVSGQEIELEFVNTLLAPYQDSRTQNDPEPPTIVDVPSSPSTSRHNRLLWLLPFLIIVCFTIVFLPWLAENLGGNLISSSNTPTPTAIQSLRKHPLTSTATIISTRTATTTPTSIPASTNTFVPSETPTSVPTDEPIIATITFSPIAPTRAVLPSAPPPTLRPSPTIVPPVVASTATPPPIPTTSSPSEEEESPTPRPSTPEPPTPRPSTPEPPTPKPPTPEPPTPEPPTPEPPIPEPML